MSVELNHTIVWATDREKSAEFLAGILGLRTGPVTGPFVPIELANGVTLDYLRVDRVTAQHYAFLVGEADFDAAMARIEQAGIAYWADPFHERAGEVDVVGGGRRVYFADPDGHNMELLTRGS
ncbi:VOC family protein [Amycolatopsis australiensis]|uniref:Catechol 2,3-dioxygenase n=1 Tax=Amycolatopsis australiensis TaxID=546364 RepID=A0A1K1SEI7_9PSEU|nr:VOC family protein [Amycolatopsis australiensis]SFW82710.1 Catechol 2,3-dioxygenase [Amycolatopsis australiensis]